MGILIIPFIYIVYVMVNIILAKIEALKIEDNIVINHAKNAVIYTILVSPVYFIVLNNFHLKIYPFIICLAMFFLRRVVYDTALNLYRKLALNYISTKTSSIEDIISFGLERKIGYYLYHLIFLVISIGLAFVKI